MRKVFYAVVLISIVAVVMASPNRKISAPETVYNFRFTEKEATQIIQSASTSEVISAKDAAGIVSKIQAQVSDSTLNPRKK